MAIDKLQMIPLGGLGEFGKRDEFDERDEWYGQSDLADSLDTWDWSGDGEGEDA